MRPQQARILRVLREKDARDLMHAFDCEDLADRMDMPWDRLQPEVVDLEEKGYVVLKYRPIGTLILCNVYLTIKGIEWVEKNPPPPPPPPPGPMAQIFLSYAREDEKKVEELHQKLSAAGFKPWMDKKDILPGEEWASCIREAIDDSDFFLVCLSTNSFKKRGWVQREMKRALHLWQEKLEDDIYLIPVRLEECEAPKSLRKFQWVNLFEEDGWEKLVKAIQVGMERRAEVPTDEELSSGREVATPEEGPERVPHMDDKRTELERELAQHEQNLRLLLGKKAIYAAGEEPLHLLNQIEAEKREIQSIEQRLAQLTDKPLPVD